MAKGIVIETYGGPEVLKLRNIDLHAVKKGEVRIKHSRIGVNYHDTYVRSGQYKTLKLPGIPGIEAVGVIIEASPEITNLRVGDRVAYVTGEYGVYCTERNIDASEVYKIPDTISDDVAGSSFLRGLTVEMLVRRVHRVSKGENILIQAAAGGMGQLLCQWASHLGAIVTGTVRTDEQAEKALAAGCRHIIRYKDEDVPERIMEITQGQGADVVYDGVGLSTFQGSVDALTLCGHLVNFGQSSGTVPPLNMTTLSAKSLTLSRPVIFHYLKDSRLRGEMVQSVFSALETGVLKVSSPRKFDLADAEEAHQILEKEGASVPLLLSL